ncbi:hypothetical protein RKD18_006479 [Streptomyces phaeoluteigriseus]
MSAAVLAGVRQTAAYRDTWSLTATFSASGAYPRASSQATSSPVTSTTGTPYSATTRALSSPSLARTSFSHTPVMELAR